MDLFTIQNLIPFYSIILEGSAGLGISVLAVRMIQKYRSRPQPATIPLLITLVGYSLAAFTAFSGKVLDFYSSVPQSVISFSGYFNNLSYIGIGIANIALIYFTMVVFREVNERLLLYFTFIEAIVVGTIIEVNSFVYGSYSDTFLSIIGIAALSLFANLWLVIESLKARSQSEERLSRTGFFFIAIFGISLTLVFVFFGLDVVTIQLGGPGFSIFYVLAWFMTFFASFSGYLGYTMPNWFRKILSLE